MLVGRRFEIAESGNTPLKYLNIVHKSSSQLPSQKEQQCWKTSTLLVMVPATCRHHKNAFSKCTLGKIREESWFTVSRTNSSTSYQPVVSTEMLVALLTDSVNMLIWLTSHMCSISAKKKKTIE